MSLTVEPDGHGFYIIAWSAGWVDNNIKSTQPGWSNIGDTIHRAIVRLDGLNGGVSAGDEGYRGSGDGDDVAHYSSLNG